ncbi:MAG TPA: penicillin-binding protein 1A [Aestuariivirgaceae bacterium]|jgi:penicillin-binding protein 1A
MLRFLGFLFATGFILFCGLAVGAGYLIWQTQKDLPDYKQLALYEPPVMTRVHAADGSLIAEYAKERRLFVPVGAMPKQLIAAFLSAEDKNFYHHSGLDWQGISRALVMNAKARLTGGSRKLVGASTITQQVAKNFLLSSEQTAQRKLKEALLAKRIEQAFSKDQILELYLNEIFLGLNAYGVAAAALNYFGKALNGLSVDEMAYLAALPKGPNNYHPFKQKRKAIERRNWVLTRMAENGYITVQEANALQQKPLGVTQETTGASLFSAESFAEEVRRELLALYGEDKLYNGGLSIRTTLDPKNQIIARQALTRGLLKFDRSRGYRGSLTTIDPAEDWGRELAKFTFPADLAPWTLAVVLESGQLEARIGLRPEIGPAGKPSPERMTAVIPLDLLKWARTAGDEGVVGPEIASVSDVLKPGDVVYVAPAREKGHYHLVQMPEVEGALVAMDPHTGRVLALVGGFSYGKSQFNRAVQAMRQPGSSFKPFVYAAALDSGYTPSSVVLDAPIEIKLQSGELWAPQNYTKKFYGPSTLRRGIELSRNVMTVRLAQDLGMKRVAELAERLGIYDHMLPVLANSLGAGETTLLRMTAAYSMLNNGGKRITPTLIDRVQDRYGRTVFRHDKRDCASCKAEEWGEQPEPELLDNRDEVVNPYTAYQITSMLEGVVDRGTGQRVKAVGKPVAGKTGTSNDEKDAWFIGYTPDLTVGVYVGYDNPRPMGRDATGGELASPIVADFLKLALKDKPATPFRVPSGVQLIPIDSATGQRAAYGDPNVILEAFKPGEGPADETIVIGANTAPADGEAAVIEGGLTTGTGGLY